MESKNKEIRCCFFDMGNVLVHFSHELMCEQMGSLCNRSGSAIHELIIQSRLFEKMERGELSESEFHDQFQSLVSQKIDHATLKKAASDIFELNEDMPPLLEELKRLGIRLIVLSNTGKSHFEFIQEQFEILDYFDHFTLSYQVGALKPSPEIYLDAIEKSGYLPEECFYTDDISKYIDSARGLGIQAQQFHNTEQLREAMKSVGIPLN